MTGLGFIERWLNDGDGAEAVAEFANDMIAS